MAVSAEFLEYVLDQLQIWAEVRAKRMFGGAGLYREGKMFALVANDVLYFRAGEMNRHDYQNAGSQPFQPSQGKKILMPYYEVPGHVLEDPEELARWAEKALSVAKREQVKVDDKIRG